jgi:type I restriction enzyme S subunit
MSTEEKTRLLPMLRFPEFRNQESWTEQRLIDTADRSTKWSFIGGPFGSNLKSSDYVSDGVRIIQLQNIGDGEFHDTYRIFTSEEKADELLSNNIYPGEIIISKMGDPVGRACLIPEWHDRYVMCSDGIRLVVDENEHNKYFIYSLINSPLFRSLVEKTATGSTRKRIGLDELRELPMRLPKKSEQEKIADCLSSLDKLIAAQARKVEALKIHKKGLMQQLFPREGETHPRLRFSEFQNTGDWSEGKLEDIATVLQGYGFPERHQGQTSGDYPFYKVSDISRSLAIGNVFIKESANYVNVDLLKELRAKLIPEGTTIFAKIGEAIRSNKRVVTTAPCLIDNNAAGVKRIDGKATDLFIYFLMEQISLIDHAGGVVPSVNKSAIESITVRFPEPDEQQRIADCLTSLDTLITAAAQELNTLKTHKKGLMQQLFPLTEEA